MDIEQHTSDGSPPRFRRWVWRIAADAGIAIVIVVVTYACVLQVQAGSRTLSLAADEPASEVMDAPDTGLFADPFFESAGWDAYVAETDAEDATTAAEYRDYLHQTLQEELWLPGAEQHFSHALDEMPVLRSESLVLAQQAAVDAFTVACDQLHFGQTSQEVLTSLADIYEPSVQEKTVFETVTRRAEIECLVIL